MALLPFLLCLDWIVNKNDFKCVGLEEYIWSVNDHYFSILFCEFLAEAIGLDYYTIIKLN